jgi:hypothetical protein
VRQIKQSFCRRKKEICEEKKNCAKMSVKAATGKEIDVTENSGKKCMYVCMYVCMYGEK